MRGLGSAFQVLHVLHCCNLQYAFVYWYKCGYKWVLFCFVFPPSEEQVIIVVVVVDASSAFEAQNMLRSRPLSRQPRSQLSYLQTMSCHCE
jgi:hypothetical protein